MANQQISEPNIFGDLVFGQRIPNLRIYSEYRIIKPPNHQTTESLIICCRVIPYQRVQRASTVSEATISQQIICNVPNMRIFGRSEYKINKSLSRRMYFVDQTAPKIHLILASSAFHCGMNLPDNSGINSSSQTHTA